MNGSLYSLLVSQHPDQLVPMRCRAPLLGRLVRYFEDLVVENNLRALVVQGRCVDGSDVVERRRFCRLSTAARYHYVFTCGPNCPSRTWSVPTFPNSTIFEHRDFHEFDTGPFLIIVHPHFSGVLVSHRVVDEQSDTLPYEVVWSFEPNVVYSVLEYLHARVAAQHREHESEFVRQLRESSPSSASLRLTLNLTTKLAQLLQRQTEIETAISRISAMISGALNMGEIYQAIVEQVAKSLGVRRVALAVWHEHNATPEAVHEAIRPARDTAPSGEYSSGELRPPLEPIEAPIISRGVAVGLLTVEDDSSVRVWEEEEMMMVRTVADHLAVGISNARLFRQIEEQAMTDELTGLFNRRYFHDRLERECQFAQRSGQPVSLIVLDLDRLKRINDTFGHPMGDAVLRHVGDTLKAVVRNVDVCARYGGEEFVVILPYTDQPGALLAAERLRTAVSARPLPPVGRVTASFGISTFPGTAPTPAALVEQADRAMYVAKHSGRDRVAMPGDAVEEPLESHFSDRKLDSRLVEDGLLDERI
jgi:diguanylate cyclase (GGDEF)-like protein